MKEQYFVIMTTEEGTCITKIHDIDAYLKEAADPDGDGIEFMDDFPEDRWSKKRDKIYRENWHEYPQVILIKGKIVVPKKVKVVEKYEMDEDDS